VTLTIEDAQGRQTFPPQMRMARAPAIRQRREGLALLLRLNAQTTTQDRGFRMYDFSADEQPLDNMIDVDLPVEELERLTRVDALLRLVAARDRRVTIALDDWPAAACSRVDPEPSEGIRNGRDLRLLLFLSVTRRHRRGSRPAPSPPLSLLYWFDSAGGSAEHGDHTRRVAVSAGKDSPSEASFVAMNVYTLRVEPADDLSVEQIRWELFVHREIRDVSRFVDGTLAIAYEGDEPNVATWQQTLISCGLEVLSPDARDQRSD
jgi:hypothetical protein